MDDLHDRARFDFFSGNVLCAAPQGGAKSLDLICRQANTASALAHHSYNPKGLFGLCKVPALVSSQNSASSRWQINALLSEVFASIWLNIGCHQAETWVPVSKRSVGQTTATGRAENLREVTIGFLNFERVGLYCGNVQGQNARINDHTPTF